MMNLNISCHIDLEVVRIFYIFVGELIYKIMIKVEFDLDCSNLDCVKKAYERIKVKFEEIHTKSISEFLPDEETIRFENFNWVDIEDINDTLCEQICNTYKAYCYITDTSKNIAKEFYFDEDDGWSYN